MWKFVKEKKQSLKTFQFSMFKTSEYNMFLKLLLSTLRL